MACSSVEGGRRGSIPIPLLLLIRLSSLADVLFPPDSMKVGLVEDRNGRERKMWKTESERTNRTCAISSDEEMEKGTEGCWGKKRIEIRLGLR